MATYILLGKLTDEGRKTVKQRPMRIEEVNREVEVVRGEGYRPVRDHGPLRLRDRHPGARQRDGGQGLDRVRVARHAGANEHARLRHGHIAYPYASSVGLQILRGSDL